MKPIVGFLIGAVCGGLGLAAYDWIGWIIGIVCAIAIITVDYVMGGFDYEK